MEATILSCCERKFKDKDTGKERYYYALYIADPSGAVGFVYSNASKKPGDKVKLELAVNRDGRFTVRVAA